MAYQKTFRTRSGKVVKINVKGRKHEPKHYISGLEAPPAKGTCKQITLKGGCKQKLCFTGRGVTGWTFMKGTRVCGR